MNNNKIENKYVERAVALGLDISDPEAITGFLCTLRALQVRYSSPKRITQKEIADQLGVSQATVGIWLSAKRWVEMANEILLAEILSDEARADVKQQLFYTYHTLLPDAVQNIAEIAAGKKEKASYRDQVLAYEALMNNSLGEAFLSSLFLGEQGNSEEDNHIAMRDSLRAKGQVLLMDAPPPSESLSTPTERAQQPLLDSAPESRPQ